MLDEKSWLPTLMLTVLAGCSSSGEESGKASASLRPGVEDSNAAYKGTANENENAFWVAVRNGDDVGRAAAAGKLSADVAADPKNGYSHFLVGANAFMAPSEALRALANGSEPPAAQGGPTLQGVGPSFERALANLTDPFYLGFAGGLLASLELRSGNVAQGGPRFAAAARNNAIATGFINVLGDFAANDAKKALQDEYALLEHCNGGALDRTGADAEAFVAKQNAGTLKQRECYSGYHAPHGSPGLTLILADLHALNGEPAVAKAYYDALTRANDYPTWPLKPLVERRRAGEAATFGQAAAIAGTCGTCHTNALP